MRLQINAVLLVLLANAVTTPSFAKDIIRVLDQESGMELNVYTVAWVDAVRTVEGKGFALMQATNQKKVAELEQMLAVLRKNVQDLSNMNDALTKRLDEMEKRVVTKP